MIELGIVMAVIGALLMPTALIGALLNLMWSVRSADGMERLFTGHIKAMIVLMVGGSLLMAGFIIIAVGSIPVLGENPLERPQ